MTYYIKYLCGTDLFTKFDIYIIPMPNNRLIIYKRKYGESQLSPVLADKVICIDCYNDYSV